MMQRSVGRGSKQFTVLVAVVCLTIVLCSRSFGAVRPR